MSVQIDIPATEVTFKQFLLHNRRYRIALFLSAAAVVIQFSVFKYLYPYASFIHGDSFSYLHSAYQNLDINTYMVGYSKFLRLLSVFTNSDTALVAVQYLFIHISCLFFLFTLFYFYKPSKVVQVFLLCFMVLNPLFLYMANYVSSDSIFLALSFTWLTLLLWLIHRPSHKIIFWHTLVLFITFTVRYNALIYPFIAVIAFWMSKLPVHKKVIGIAGGTLVCGLFILYTGSKYKQLTGIWQYSPFSGWQMANNAMYAYRYVDSTERKPVDPKFKILDNMIREYFDSTRDVLKYPQEMVKASTAYMWSPGSSLYKYRKLQFHKDSTASELKRWASMGPFYKEYGIYIIKQYPVHYVQYFLWPNFNKYFSLPVEFLDSYNSGKDSVAPIAKLWFGYKSLKITTRTKNLKVATLDFYPILAGVSNVVFLCSLICFLMLNRLREFSYFRNGVFLVSTIWLINAGFTIFASSAALRFQSFPLLLTFTFAILLVDWLSKMAVNKEIHSDNLSNVIGDALKSERGNPSIT